jgi:hypothetical protein
MSDYKNIANGIAELIEDKQRQYGDSFSKSGKIMAILYPDGIPLEALDDALVVVRVIDKLFRIATAAGKKDGGGENPWNDVCGYALLSIKRDIDKAP